MTEQELDSLKTVINFLWRDEQKHFEECELNDGHHRTTTYSGTSKRWVVT